ncbi:universal stress protein [Herbidospora sp. NEAU-GS84]|uniref:Universal stress protein n=1 Tax=Herbidospora solisilvae TaxID=2696284 RepID=A0A7C9P071_9ACTN|nr:universal stress protein [Herbidospora solisilvae]NAS22737.1 universal stress protein [Herbidospora solisilvae]
MNIVTGFVPDSGGQDALALAGVFARTLGGHVRVAVVRPAVWETPGPAKADAEWRAYLLSRESAALSLAEKAAREAGLDDAEAVSTVHRSAGLGLNRLSAQETCDLIVIGSAPHGPVGRIAVGSTADQLLHSSHTPVCLAPQGYAADPPAALDRITFGYDKSHACEDALLLAIRAAGTLQLPLRLITVLPIAPQVPEDVLEQVRARYEHALRAAVRSPRRTAALPRGVTTEVLAAPDASEALAGTDWTPGELLVCGSSSAGPLRRVFVGDMSLKVLRAAPCPVVVLPRAAAG